MPGKEVPVWMLPLLLILLLAGCSALTVAGQFQAGRRALLAGDSETAVGYFSPVAEQNPNYVNVIQNYRESVWTYLGRALYETKRYPEARKSLERALAMDRNDGMARLYLGLVLLRMGDVSRGVKEVEAGMKGLYDWIEYMNRTQPFQAFWDPTYRIRKQIDQDLAAITGKDFKLEQLIEDAEWVGRQFEEELDKVRDDERRQFERDLDRDRRGLGLGLGIGF
jgi:tetratricopeptide (TPR) repeat protein